VSRRVVARQLLPLCLALFLAVFGRPALAMLQIERPTQADWLNVISKSRGLDLPAKVMRTRTLFHNIAWSADSEPDGYWATPAELLRRGSGDLLDLVTAYYFTLRGMGVPAGDIRMFFGKIRTIDQPVPHIMLAVRAGAGTTYFVDPLRETAMTDETPTEFRPTLAINEAGAWRTGALTDLSVWDSLGSNPENVPRWLGVCYSALGMLGLLQAPPPAVDVAALLEAEPPASGGRKSKARAKKSGKAKAKPVASPAPALR
jgi:hypothetical protein